MDLDSEKVPETFSSLLGSEGRHGYIYNIVEMTSGCAYYSHWTNLRTLTANERNNQTKKT